MKPDLSNRLLGGSKDKTCQRVTEENGRDVGDTIIMLLAVVYGIFKLSGETHQVTALPEGGGSLFLPCLWVGGRRVFLSCPLNWKFCPDPASETAVSEETPACFTNSLA